MYDQSPQVAPTPKPKEQPSAPPPIDDFIEQRRSYYGIPKNLVKSLTETESRGQHTNWAGGVKTSSQNARGRFQVLPDTAKQYGLNSDNEYENAEAGLRYLSDLNKKVHPDVKDVGERWAATIAGYHSGEGGLNEVNRSRNLPNRSDANMSTTDYTKRVFDRWRQLDTNGDGKPDGASNTQRSAPSQQPSGIPQGIAVGHDQSTPRPLSVPGQPKILPRRPDRPTTDNVFAIGARRDKDNQTHTALVAKKALDFRPEGGERARIQEQAMRINRRVDPDGPQSRNRQALEGIDKGQYTPEQSRAIDAANAYSRKGIAGKAAHNIGAALDATGSRLSDTLVNAGEAAGGLATGDFRPAKEALTGLVQGIEKIGADSTIGRIATSLAGNTGTQAEAELNDAIAYNQREQAARRAGDNYWEGSKITTQRAADAAAAAPGMGAKITRGATEAVLGLPMMAGAAMAGGVPALTTLTAAQQDFVRDPEGAILNTATAGVPIVAGRAISPFAANVARGVRPGMQKAAQIGIEGGAGGAANAGQYAGTQAMLGREIDPSEAVAQGVTGLGLSAAMSPRMGRVGAPSRPTAFEHPDVVQMAARAQDRPGQQGTTITNMQGRGLPTVEERLNRIPGRSTAWSENAAGLRMRPQGGGAAQRVRDVDGPQVGEQAAQVEAPQPQAPAEINLANQNKVRATNQARATARSAAKVQSSEAQAAPRQRVARPLASTGDQSKNRSLENVENLDSQVNAPTRDLTAPLLRPEAQVNPEDGKPEIAQEKPARGLQRNYRAGMNDGSVIFDSETQRDLYDLGASLRGRGLQGGKNRNYKQEDRIEPLYSSLQERTGLSREEVQQRALDTHDDVKSQMKGVKHLEERKVADKFAEKPVDFTRLADEQNALQAKKPSKRDAKDTKDLTLVGALKRKNPEGYRDSQRGEAQTISAKEEGIVGLTNKKSRTSIEDAAYELDDLGKTLPDGRRFVEDGRIVAKPDEIREYIREHAREKVGGTAELNRRLAQEEAEYEANRPVMADSPSKQWARSLPDADTIDQMPNVTDKPYSGKFVEGELSADRWGDDPYVYQSKYVNPADFKNNLKLEDKTYDQVVQMPTTQQYIKWYKEGFEPPPITVVVNQTTGKPFASDRRRVVAALEAGVSRIPARVEMGRASEVHGAQEFQPDSGMLRDVAEYGRAPEPDAPPIGRRQIRPPAPPQPRAPLNRPTPTDVNMSVAFPRARRAMVEAGKLVQEEITAGRGKAGPHGKVGQQMFKSSSGKVLHGQDSFFHDPQLKGRLGLTRDAEMGEVKSALTRQLSRLMRIKPGQEVSLTQVTPEVWRQFAAVKGLGPDARAKMELAIMRGSGETNGQTKTGVPETDVSGSGANRGSETVLPADPESAPRATNASAERPAEPVRESSANEKNVAKDVAGVEADRGGAAVAPKSQNFTQFATERGLASDYDVIDHGDLGPSGQVSGRARKAAQGRQADRAAQNKQAHQEYEDAIRKGEVIDPSGKITKDSLDSGDKSRAETERQSKIASIDAQIRTIENLGQMSHGRNGKLKPKYQRTVDIYNQEKAELLKTGDQPKTVTHDNAAKTETYAEEMKRRADEQYAGWKGREEKTQAKPPRTREQQLADVQDDLAGGIIDGKEAAARRPEINKREQAKTEVKPNEETKPTAAPASKRSVLEPVKASGRVARGRESTLTVPRSKTQHAIRYEVRELGDIQASHNPFSFEKNPDYRLVNDRDYGNPANRMDVEDASKAGAFNPRLMLTDDPTATNGPPVVYEGGDVLGGNSRTMMLARVYRNHPVEAQEYRKGIEERASMYGINARELKRFDQPVLVRVIDAKPENLQKLITDLNVQPGKAMTSTEAATARGKNLPPETMKFLGDRLFAEGPDGTLAEALRGQKGIVILDRLIRDGSIPSGERNKYLTDQGEISAVAKAEIEGMMLGRMFDSADQMKATPASVKNKLARIAPQLAKLSGSGWDISKLIPNALRAAESSKNQQVDLEMLNRRGSLFEGTTQYTPEELAIARYIKELGPRQLENKFTEYVSGFEQSEKGAGLFGDPPKQSEIFDDVFKPARESRSSFGPLKNEPQGPIAGIGLGGLQDALRRKPKADALFPPIGDELKRTAPPPKGLGTIRMEGKGRVESGALPIPPKPLRQSGRAKTVSAQEYLDSQLNAPAKPAKTEAERAEQSGKAYAKGVLRTVGRLSQKDAISQERQAALVEASDGLLRASRSGDAKAIKEAKKNLQAAALRAEAEPDSGRDSKGRDYFTSPLSNLNFKGGYERAAGQAGKEVSEAFSEAQFKIAQDQSTAPEAMGELRRRVGPLQEELRLNGKPGVADMIDDHLRAISGRSTPFKKTLDTLKAVNYFSLLRFNPRSAVINALQPIQTLWPHLKTTELAEIYRKAYFSKETRLRISDVAQRESGSQIEGTGKPGRFAKIDLFRIPSEANRRMGHLAGEMFADRIGLVGDEKARMAADWAKKVEFDNSKYNIPPLFRGDIASTVGQFKPFLMKNLERIGADWKRAASQYDRGDYRAINPSGNLARRSKMIAGQLALGGVRSMIPGLKHLGGVVALGAMAKAFQSSGMDEEKANKAAEAVYFGAPALVGTDFSGSMMVLDEPFGNTAAEQMVNFFGGPTMSRALDLGKQSYAAISPDGKTKATRGEQRTRALQKIGKNVIPKPLYRVGETALAARRGKTPTMQFGKETVPMTLPEAIAHPFGGTPVRQTEYYQQKDAYGWQKNAQKKMGIKPLPQKPGARR